MNITDPTQEPIFAQDINLAVNIVSTLNKYEYIYIESNILFCFKSITETVVANLTADDALFEVNDIN